MKKHRLTWIPASSSLIMFGVVVTLALHTRLGLGHWPKPMVDDYDETLYNLHELFLVIVGYFAVYAAIPLWLLSFYFPAYRNDPKHRAIQLGLIIFGWLLICLLYVWDYRNFVTWLLD